MDNTPPLRWYKSYSVESFGHTLGYRYPGAFTIGRIIVVKNDVKSRAPNSLALEV
jgi:hypothetical protein